MNLSLPALGQKLKKNSWLYLSIALSLFVLLTLKIYPLSTGDKYTKKLSKYYHLLDTKQFDKADQFEAILDKEDIEYVASLSHPKYITRAITKILKKPDRNTDDLIEVTLLYFKIGDIKNGQHFLLLAQQLDPVRSDIDRLIQKLF